MVSLASDFLDIKQDMKKGKSKKIKSNRGSKDAFEDKLDRDLLGGVDFKKHQNDVALSTRGPSRQNSLTFVHSAKGRR